VADETTPPAIDDRIQGRPLPSAPVRPLRRNSKEPSSERGPTPQGRLSRSASGTSRNKLAKSASGTSANTISTLDQWHSVRSTMPRSTTDDDTTLHSAADTLVGSDDLHSCADTLNDPHDLGSDDEHEYFSEMLPRDRNSRHFDDS
jgi:hypothetical protein